MVTETVFLSILVPVFNEIKKIGTDIFHINDYFTKQDYSIEILIVDDGSTDGTHELLNSLRPEYPVLRILHHAPNQGKGYAAKRGILESRGHFVLLVDAGNCADYKDVEIGLKFLHEGYDCAFGSRVLPDSRIIRRQRIYRRVGSWAFGMIVRKVLGIDWIRDTQCGFKMFCHEAARHIFSKNTVKGFMFDIETILNARKMGYNITEFPISWKYDPDSRFRTFSGSIKNVSELMKIKLGV